MGYIVSQLLVAYEQAQTRHTSVLLGFICPHIVHVHAYFAVSLPFGFVLRRLPLKYFLDALLVFVWNLFLLPFGCPFIFIFSVNVICGLRIPSFDFDLVGTLVLHHLSFLVHLFLLLQLYPILDLKMHDDRRNNLLLKLSVSISAAFEFKWLTKSLNLRSFNAAIFLFCIFLKLNDCCCSQKSCP